MTDEAMIEHPDMPQNDDEVLFPIGTLSNKTGVKTVTLRAWERRYGLLKPKRTPKGHRLYSIDDLERVNKVLVLLNQGIPVNRVRKILDSDSPFPDLVALDDSSKLKDEDPWWHFGGQIRDSVAALDARVLERAFGEVSSLYSLDLVAKKLILPLYAELQHQARLLPSMAAEYAFLHEFLVAQLGAGYLRKNKNLPRHHQSLLFIAGEDAGDCIKTLLLANISNVHEYQANVIGSLATLDALPLALQRMKVNALVVVDRHVDLEKIQVLAQTTELTLFVDELARADAAAEVTGIEWLNDDLTAASTQIYNTLSAPTSAAISLQDK